MGTMLRYGEGGGGVGVVVCHYEYNVERGIV